jgi:hypothetical protein
MFILFIYLRPAFRLCFAPAYFLSKKQSVLGWLIISFLTTMFILFIYLRPAFRLCFAPAYLSVKKKVFRVGLQVAFVRSGLTWAEVVIM